jgi:hypothetical protein
MVNGEASEHGFNNRRTRVQALQNKTERYLNVFFYVRFFF